MTDEEYVRAHWGRAEECPAMSGKRCCISLGGRGFTRVTVPQTISGYAATKELAWAAAAEYTRERLEQIRQLEEEIDNQRMIFGPDFDRYDLDKWSDHLDGTCEAEMHVHVRIMDFVRTQCSISRTLARLESALTDLRRGMK